MALKETDLLNAWLWDKHRTDVQWRRVRLGVLPTKELNRMYMTIMKWADAIFLNDGIVHIVEAKIRPNFGATGQLKGYKMLFPQTPEFTAYRDWPIKMILLTMTEDLNTIESASQEGIEYEIFTLEDINRVRIERLQKEIEPPEP